MEPQPDRRDPIRLVGATLDRRRHSCAFFHSPDEEYRVLLPFLAEGFARGDRAYPIVDPALRQVHLRRLQQAGIDTDAAERAVRVAELGGRLPPRRPLRPAPHARPHPGGSREGPARGFPLTRIVARMEWALEDRPGVEDLVEYETRLNDVLLQYEDPII